MKRYFSGITAQQAPSPRAARQALESLAGVLQTASTMPHRTNDTSAFTSSASNTRVTMLEAIEENRFARSQRTNRLPPRGDRAGLSVEVSTAVVVAVMTLSLHQRDARVVPVHEQTDGEADGQEHQHDQRNRLNRLTGLVQRRVRDRHDILVADRHRKRGVFGQVQ